VAALDLRCPSGCDDGRFEALNAPLIVDRTGRYLFHDATAATYLCSRCQAVAVDLAGAARELRTREEWTPEVLTCPACGLEMLPPEDDPLAGVVECPACETRFSLEEGMDRLHGNSGGAPAER
jgi:DNA-directed RNA polymerase subunit RPC12/RpoP